MDALSARAADDLRSVLETSTAAREWLEITMQTTRCCAAIDRWSVPGSAYRAQKDETLGGNVSSEIRLEQLRGILAAMVDDYGAGRMASIAQLVHADTFADFLEMADYLLDEGYKDAAAVIAGSSLEAHLRNLATNAGVTVAKADGSPLKADVINADLVKAGVYEKLQAKQVTYWLGLRNHAAHGEYDLYTAADVNGLVRDVRAFILSYPA